MVANGVPANGSYVEPQGGQISVLTGGNSALAPETAETWVFGAVYSPGWARVAGVCSCSSTAAAASRPCAKACRSSMPTT